jgi:hypothetical protein
MLQLKLSFRVVGFHPNFRQFPGVSGDLFGSRDILARGFLDIVGEYLSAGIWWLTL